MDARHADRVGEAEQRGQVVADIAPGVVRAMRGGDRAGPVVALATLDLAGDQIERLVPRDTHIAGLAAVARIAVSIGVEVDALHRIEQPIGRIDDRLGVLAVRRQRGFARRREIQAARMNRPRRWVAVVELDRRHAHDLVVLDGDEDRPAIGHVAIAHRAVRHRRAEFPVRGLHGHEDLRKPICQVFRTIDAEGKILLRVDLVEPVDRRRQQRGADRRILEGERDVGLGMQPGARADFAVAQLDPAPGALVARLDLRDQIALFQARREMRMPPCHELEKLREREQNEREFRCRRHRAFPRMAGSFAGQFCRFNTRDAAAASAAGSST